MPPSPQSKPRPRPSDVRVSAAEVAAGLPGDELIAAPELVLDRAATFDGAAVEIWPWLVQLGKDRGGWYLPRALEHVMPAARRGRRKLVAEFQTLHEGDYVPDWGPGFPLYRVARLEPPRALVFLSLRDRRRNHCWPVVEEPLGEEVVAFSWALVLLELGNAQTRLQIRLRVRGAGPVIAGVGGPLDYVATQLLFIGLAERLAAARRSG